MIRKRCTPKEAYLTVQGATSYKRASSDYQSAVDVQERIPQMNPSLASLRLQELKDDACTR